MELTLPKQFNGTTFRKELAVLGVVLPDTKSAISISDSKLFIEVDDNELPLVIEALKNHNGSDVVIELTTTEKLASVGLSIDDLKAALGLGL
jgi:hypothetical protein